MRRVAAAVLGIALLAVGLLLGLYGLFAILYAGDSGGGDTYVTFSGQDVDADLAGASALLLVVIVIVAAVVTFRRREIT